MHWLGYSFFPFPQRNRKKLFQTSVLCCLLSKSKLKSRKQKPSNILFHSFIFHESFVILVKHKNTIALHQFHIQAQNKKAISMQF